MVENLRQMSPEHWDWTPHIAAPTARVLAAHTYEWLVCDRLHIIEPEVRKHPDVPSLPEDPLAACEMLSEEIDRWETMLLKFTWADFNSPRRQFGHREMNVRSFVAHMVQNCIFRNGQLSTLYFSLGYDGDMPYTAPFPNGIYREMREQLTADEANEPEKAKSRHAVNRG
ncbi:MAG: hypothetical protein SFU56_01015 [Capsulimonadales bacterium]|nr:hypothetical protein [Capsulimonadales bacterium]